VLPLGGSDWRLCEVPW
jgi:hypothetical protein